MLGENEKVIHLTCGTWGHVENIQSTLIALTSYGNIYEFNRDNNVWKPFIMDGLK